MIRGTSAVVFRGGVNMSDNCHLYCSFSHYRYQLPMLSWFLGVCHRKISSTISFNEWNSTPTIWNPLLKRKLNLLLKKRSEPTNSYTNCYPGEFFIGFPFPLFLFRKRSSEAFSTVRIISTNKHFSKWVRKKYNKSGKFNKIRSLNQSKATELQAK